LDEITNANATIARNTVITKLMRPVKSPIGSILITEAVKLLSIKSTLIIVLRQ